jgi:hypothetical protein
LALTNTLALYVTELITAIKSFTIQAPGAKVLHSGRLQHFPQTLD